MELIDKRYTISQIEQEEKEHGSVFECDSEHIKDFLRSLPTLTPESLVKRGEWRFCGADRWNDAYKCSECGKIAMDDSKFCPECGAKMVEN